MSEKLEYLYRYRSIEKLKKFKELEELSIYFSKPDELNDQMEDYMNIVWQGDEIAFKGLFKHYLYTLLHLYYIAYIAILARKDEHLDIKHLPIFISADALKAPEMETLFRDIYFEFFSSPTISKIPKIMASSGKKFTSDEMLFLLKSVHIYAFLVINTQVKKHILKEDCLTDKGYNEEYSLAKYKNYELIVNMLLPNNSNKESIVDLIDSQNIQLEQIRRALEGIYINKDNFNIRVLAFDYPQLYIKQVKRILYDDHCVACFSSTYKNEPMWSHYADNENGICLRFKIKNENNLNFLNLYAVRSVVATSKEIRVEKDFDDYQFYKVQYTDKYPEVDFFTSLGCLPHPIRTGFWLCNYDRTEFSSCYKKYCDMSKWRRNYHKKAEKYICTKSKNWAYEQEYRIFRRGMMDPVYDDPKNRIAKYNIEDLDAIIFGRKVLAEEKVNIIKIMNQHCTEKGLNPLRFYDLYYSTITKQVEMRKCSEYPI